MKEVFVTSSILIVLIAALRPILRGRIDPRVQYALWLAAALRLLIPVNFVDSAYSALALLERAKGTSQIVENIGQTTIPVPILAPLSEKDALDLVMKEREQNGQNVTDLSVEETFDVWDQVQDLQETTTTLATLVKTLARRPVWLGGAAVMAVWFLLVNLRLRRRMRDAEYVEVDCPLPVYVSDALSSPCLCGVVRPVICVTPAALESEERLRHVLAHELTHCRHRDHWWALVRCLCLCVYWFNPLVWWAAALSRQDCELACDEGAIRRLGEGERLPYGRTLVDMIAAGRTPLLQTATTMTGGRRRVRERIMLIARRPKTVVAVALALALIVGCAVGCTFTGAPEDSSKPGPAAALGSYVDRPSLDTLQERLEDIPEELRGEVALHRSDTSEMEGSYDLATYLLDNAADPDWEGWLLSVRRLDQVGFENWLYSLSVGRNYVFARDSEHYYLVVWPTSVQYGNEDASRYAAASKAIWDYAKQAVLDTQGVEPYDAEGLCDREYLWEGKTYTDVAYWPYKNINGNTDIVWILRLVQLVKGGPGGVWIPERWQVIDPEVDPTPQHIKPDTGGLTVTQYAAQLQAEADAGRADWATDPIQVCMRYAETDFAHRNVTEDCFTEDSAYIQSVLENLQPTLAQKAVQAAVDRLMAAPSVELTLAPAGTSRVYAYTTVPSEDYFSNFLSDLPTDFQWEEAPYSTSSSEDALRVSSQDRAVSLFLSAGSYLMLVEQDGETNCYKGQYLYDENGPLAYVWLRRWFDEIELNDLRAPNLVVPDQGQSHEEIARQWAMNYEGVYLKCVPNNSYRCSFMQVTDMRADIPDWLDQEGLEEFARSHNFSAEDFGKTWFGFSYNTVFVPVNQSTANPFWVGNTWYYEGDADWAPEGALTYSRIGIMQLTDEGWTCLGTGTGW